MPDEPQPTPQRKERAPVKAVGLILVECDQFTVSHRDGRILLELVGASPSEKLPEHRKYLTPTDLATRLGINVRSVRKLMLLRKNPIPHVVFGLRPRFVEDDVYRWAKEGTTVSARRARAALGSQPLTPSARIFGPRGRTPKHKFRPEKKGV